MIAKITQGKTKARVTSDLQLFEYFNNITTLYQHYFFSKYISELTLDLDVHSVENDATDSTRRHSHLVYGGVSSTHTFHPAFTEPPKTDAADTLEDDVSDTSLLSSFVLLLSSARLLRDPRLQLLAPILFYTGLEQGFVISDFTKVNVCLQPSHLCAFSLFSHLIIQPSHYSVYGHLIIQPDLAFLCQPDLASKVLCR